MNNIGRFRKILKENSLDGGFISSPTALKYLTDYQSGTSSEVTIGTFADPFGFIYIPVVGEQSYFIADPRYQGTSLRKDIEERIIPRNYGKSLIDFSIDIMKKNTKKLEILGIEKSGLNYVDGSKFVKKLAQMKIRTTAIDKMILELRSIKNNDEISKIKAAQEITDTVFSNLLKYIKPGFTEIEVGKFIESQIKSFGAELSFESIVASGSNSSTPHHINSNRKLLKNDILLLDFGAKLDGYHSDMSRTIFLGRPSKAMLTDYSAVVDNLENVIDYINSNRNVKQISHYSRELFKDFKESSYSNLHSLGHGVGLQIHENPHVHERNNSNLENGNVITVEPGVYKKGQYGIRVEDMVLIDTKVSNLTKSPKDLIILH